MGRKGEDHAIHKILWDRRDRKGCVRIQQQEFCKEVGLRNETISRMLTRMQASGRVRKVKSEKHNIGIYFIRDPEGFSE